MCKREQKEAKKAAQVCRQKAGEISNAIRYSYDVDKLLSQWKKIAKEASEWKPSGQQDNPKTYITVEAFAEAISGREDLLLNLIKIDSKEILNEFFRAFGESKYFKNARIRTSQLLTKLFKLESDYCYEYKPSPAENLERDLTKRGLNTETLTLSLLQTAIFMGCIDSAACLREKGFKQTEEEAKQFPLPKEAEAKQNKQSDKLSTQALIASKQQKAEETPTGASPAIATDEPTKDDSTQTLSKS